MRTVLDESRFQNVLQIRSECPRYFEEFLEKLLSAASTRLSGPGRVARMACDRCSRGRPRTPARMITDITLRHPDHTIIIDAKFYQKTLVANDLGKRSHGPPLPAHGAYLQHERLRTRGKPLLGMLLYPEVDRSLRLQYRLLGIPVLRLHSEPWRLVARRGGRTRSASRCKWGRCEWTGTSNDLRRVDGLTSKPTMLYS